MATKSLKHRVTVVPAEGNDSTLFKLTPEEVELLMTLEEMDAEDRHRMLTVSRALRDGHVSVEAVNAAVAAGTAREFADMLSAGGVQS